MEYMRTLPDKAFDLIIADPPYGGAGNPSFEGGGQVRTALRQIQGKHIKLDSTSTKDRMYKYRKVTPPHSRQTIQQEEGSSDTKGPG